jgi:hypothetical protein
MKRMNLAMSVFLAMGLSMFLFYGNRAAISAQEENHCFTCHTNPRKLIKITREIAESEKSKPKASAETAGEG